jgi:hypothetical protein
MAGLNNPLSKKKYFKQFTGPWNQYNETQMYDNAMAEYFAIAGIPIDFYPVDVNYNKDRIFGEDTTKRFMYKRQLTCIVKDGAFEENLVYNGFGEITQVEFQIYIHLPTFRKLVSRDALPGDNFYLPQVSNLGYEIVHVDWMTLGLEGNIFGQKNCYILTCKNREFSGEQYGVLDKNGNLIAGAPADAYVPDGSGRIKDKYMVPKPKTLAGSDGPSDFEQFADNKAIRDITQGVKDPSTGIRPGGVVLQRDRAYWGEW